MKPEEENYKDIIKKYLENQMKIKIKEHRLNRMYKKDA